MSSIQRAATILLCFYPKDFRREYGAAIVQLVCDQRRALGDASAYHRLGFWMSVVSDTLRAAFVEHKSAIQPRRVSTATAYAFIGTLLVLAAVANVLVDIVAVKLSMGIPAVLLTAAAGTSGAGLIVRSRRATRPK
jgi:hypothetical protein